MKKRSSNHRAIAGVANAKINLTLHVTGKLPNGFHEIDSLVVFTGFGDTLELEPAERYSLSTHGPYSQALPHPSENIILTALRLLEERGTGFRVNLKKSIPVSAGLGGGSMNAALALRLASNYLKCPLPTDTRKITSIGSDLPVCLTGKPSMVSGLGEKIAVLDSFPEFPLLLVNPNKPVQTQDVYKGLTKVNNSSQTPFPALGNKNDIISWIREQRNDLEPPALQLCPEIKNILSRLRDQEGCMVARMSGSGGTCFGIFQTAEQVSVAAKTIKQLEPGWWIQPTRILPV
ncbi:MAG: 4-(cytidine 5'-diphospho)-2-C-methyl-D-erythritol kinase [Paracoccaceae bacterium]|nr:4-(cytidine 5'-diphospho)-2-C-methyl-D-erythritol kinase [Paracoccaceae bacterium]